VDHENREPDGKRSKHLMNKLSRRCRTLNDSKHGVYVALNKKTTNCIFFFTRCSLKATVHQI
jgi:hypothetical protein